MLAAKKMLQVSGEKVRRKLFGEVDHEQLKKDFEANMSDDLEKAKLKWNFDFKKEIPLEGKYEWLRVEGPHQQTTKPEVLENLFLEITSQKELEDPLQETKTQKGEDPLQETKTQEGEDPLQETKTQEGEDPLQETTAQEVLEDPLLEATTQERVEESQQEVATMDGDTTSHLVCCKRKQSLVTDHYPVKRRCSPLPSPSHCSQ